MLADDLPPPTEAAPSVRKVLAELVPEGASSVSDRALDDTGSFDCLETIKAQPEEERPGCPRAGYIVRARTLLSTYRRGNAETPRLVETPLVADSPPPS